MCIEKDYQVALYIGLLTKPFFFTSPCVSSDIFVSQWLKFSFVAPTLNFPHLFLVIKNEEKKSSFSKIRWKLFGKLSYFLVFLVKMFCGEIGMYFEKFRKNYLLKISHIFNRVVH